MSLLAVVMVGFAGAVFGGMGAWAASRQRSAFVEIANAEIESLRALPYDVVGVNTRKDPTWSDAYPSAKRGGRDYVDVTALDTAQKAPLSVSTVTTSAVKGLTLPYTVRRWVTWSDVSGGSGHVFKRLELQVDWTENARVARSISLTSVLYPGGKGSATANNNPAASFTVSPGQSVNALSPVSFDASASTDPDGDAMTYSWSFGDGTSILGASATTHTYATAGTYSVVLTVGDVRGGAGTSAKTMTVAGALNQPPVAAFSRTPSSGTAPVSVNVDATSSSDPNGDALTYAWSWGDGTANGSGVNATHSYTTAGTFTITLTAKDTSNATSTATSTVQVNPLNCDVITGWFKNPGTNGTNNDISVTGNNKPSNNAFVFFATSNAACTSISARLPDSSGIWAVTLTATETTNGVVSWQGTGDFANRDRFNTGSSQTGEFWSPGSTGTADKVSFTFNVH
ncbi:MAG: hypothetical protein QOE35_113 [Actinomycetota bacterium]